nr:immunoglobulin light chain junction region [Macaca mulatta]MOW73520.1 immunoglobulin light chain junction region [Macaca mulatta]MOW74077.1 immunoglobulin light chain junction region [Macaca mulatta]MOW74211.1 immunoglobulin light chain junction region [Macaca mulatta]MOW74447.1 immunoglobulin light chain junction region [Macaca mulatta]
CMQAIQIPRTF